MKQYRPALRLNIYLNKYTTDNMEKKQPPF